MKNAALNKKSQDNKSLDSIERGKEEQHINSDKVSGGGVSRSPLGGDSSKTKAG